MIIVRRMFLWSSREQEFELGQGGAGDVWKPQQSTIESSTFTKRSERFRDDS